jgi:hypothetical protein
MIVRICGFVSAYAGHGMRQATDSGRIIGIDSKSVENVEGCEQRTGDGWTARCESNQRSRLFKPKILKIISLEETGFADMYPSLAGRLLSTPRKRKGATRLRRIFCGG